MMRRIQLTYFAAAIFVILLLCAACGDNGTPGGRTTVRIGHFPNITHAHGLVAHAMQRKGRDWFGERIGNNTKTEFYVYNAGPGAMEALIAGSIDVTYVGPSPAINAYIKSKGAGVRVFAGATRGGSALVVPSNATIQGAVDFKNKKIATPQLGNTQDVSCRAWLTAGGLKVTQTGGDVFVIPTANPDQLDLFSRGEVDGVWTVEPWVSRLELEANGKVYLEEKDTITTVLAGSEDYIQKNAAAARRVLDAHRALTEWILQNESEAKSLIREELAAETTRSISEKLLTKSWPRMTFGGELKSSEFESFVDAAKRAGFLKDAGDVSNLLITLK